MKRRIVIGGRPGLIAAVDMGAMSWGTDGSSDIPGPFTEPPQYTLIASDCLAGRAVAWQPDCTLRGGCWEVDVCNESCDLAGAREFVAPILLTRGRLVFADWEDLARGYACGGDWVTTGDPDVEFRLTPGAYNIRVIQLYDPATEYDADVEAVLFGVRGPPEQPAFHVEVTPRVEGASAPEFLGTQWRVPGEWETGKCRCGDRR